VAIYSGIRCATGETSSTLCDMRSLAGIHVEFITMQESDDRNTP